MALWTLGTIMSEATARAGHRADLDASVVSRLANQAYYQVAQEAEHGLLEVAAYTSILSGESRIPLPDDCDEPLVLSYLTSTGGSGRTITHTSVERAASKGLLPSGTPEEYVLFNNWIEFLPSPNSSWSIIFRYKAYPTEMIATSAVPSVGTEWAAAIMYLTEALVHERVGNKQEGAVARGVYVNYVSSLKDAIAKRQAERTPGSMQLVHRRNRRKMLAHVNDADFWRRT